MGVAYRQFLLRMVEIDTVPGAHCNTRYLVLAGVVQLDRYGG